MELRTGGNGRNRLINPLNVFFQFGSVPPGEVVSQEVGINLSPPPPHFMPYPINRPANVSAQIINDTSGGLFKVIAITITTLMSTLNLAWIGWWKRKAWVGRSLSLTRRVRLRIHG